MILPKGHESQIKSNHKFIMGLGRADSVVADNPMVVRSSPASNFGYAGINVQNFRKIALKF